MQSKGHEHPSLQTSIGSQIWHFWLISVSSCQNIICSCRASSRTYIHFGSTSQLLKPN